MLSMQPRIPSVAVCVRGDHLSVPRFVPCAHEDADLENPREAALVLPVHLALDAFAFEDGLEDLCFGEVIGGVNATGSFASTGKSPQGNS